MQIYNANESGISMVHRPGKVITQLGRRTVYSLSSVKRGKTHMALVCVSVTGNTLLPMMVNPRERPVLVKMDGSTRTFIYSGGIFLLQKIPRACPVLLIQDGHMSHMSIEAIEFAKDNNIHILCLPSYATHLLQPLDAGVLKSFKANFSKACSTYIAQHPVRVITAEVLSAMVAAAWSLSLTPVNIMSGFRKCGLFPFNPNSVDDRRLTPSKAFRT